MRWSRAFIYASIFSYAAAIVMIAVNFPPATVTFLPLFSGFIWISILIYSLYDNSYNYLWGAFFGFTAMLSFSGLVQWINYSGTLDLNLFMSAWDLLIAVALLVEVE